MIRTIIVEDEDNCYLTLEALLEEFSSELSIIGRAKSIKDAKGLIAREDPDLVFLDIELQDGTSFDLLDQINYTNFAVVFTTGHNSYAIQAFKVNAIDYLQKPIDPDDLAEAVKKVVKNRNRETIYQNVDKLLDHIKISSGTSKQKIEIPTDDGKQYVSVNDIIRIEADGSYSRIYLADGEEIFVSKNIKEIEANLPPDEFFRTHKSHLINMGFVKRFIRIDGGKVRMSDGQEIPIARRKKDDFLTIMKQYID